MKFAIFAKKVAETFGHFKKTRYLCTRFRERNLARALADAVTLGRALSSAGSERLPYKQRVGGSNPSAPTSLEIDSFGSLAQLNRAFDYGSKGYRFESCASHI